MVKAEPTTTSRKLLASRRRLRLAWQTTLVGALIFAGCQSTENYTETMAAGDRLIEAGAWQEALEHFDRTQASFPQESEPVNKLAFVADRLGRPEVAVPVLEERIAAGGPRTSTYHEILATILENAVELPLAAHNQRGAKRALKAEHHYRETLRLRPDAGPIYFRLSRLASRTGRNDVALEVAAEGIAKLPENSELHSWYGDLLMKQGRHQEAEGILQRALELDSDDGYPHYVLGVVYLHTDRPANARPHLERATELRPTIHGGWYQLANACERLGDLEARDQALAEFERLFRQVLDTGATT